MRLIRVPLILVFLLATLSASPATAYGEEAEPMITFEGHGWGHGVGMSQYGARAMAVEGYTSDEIVEHYYSGAVVTPLTEAASGWLIEDPDPLWVNLKTTSGSVSLAEVGGDLTICQQEPAWVGNLTEDKNSVELAPYNLLLEQRLDALGYDPGAIDGTFDELTRAAVEAFQIDESLDVDGIVGPDTKNTLWDYDSGDRCVIETPLGTTPLAITPESDGSQCLVETQTVAGDCVASVRDLSVSTRVRVPQKTVRDGSAIELAHGTLRIRPDRSGGIGGFEGLHVVIEIGVEDYVKGIDEIPISWHTQALEAQAIASRSYGIANAKIRGPESAFSGTTKDSCWCQLWSSTYSQVYAGYYPETIQGGRWTTAAEATSGQVLNHPSAGLVNAFFSSSNGGASEANEDAWGSKPVSYLRSVPDPWSLDPMNPFANWSKTASASSVAAVVGLDDLTGVGVVETNQSGSARLVRFVGLIGATEVAVEKSGAWVRSKFGLRSNHYEVSWGNATAPPPPPPPPPTASSVFTDVEGNTFEDDILWAYQVGVTMGCNPPENTQFCPSDPVTRGQMAAFLVRFLDLEPAEEDFFHDDAGSTFEDDINRLAAAGITKGCGADRFCPGDRVTREQMAAFLVRAFDLTDDSHPGFDDVAASNTFFRDITRLATAGITRGCNPPENSKYCPKDPVTRDQMTAFLHRASQP